VATLNSTIAPYFARGRKYSESRFSVAIQGVSCAVTYRVHSLCDYHPAFQQIAFVNTDTGELQERRLQHREEAEKFYRDLAAQGMKVRVGMEASGHARWFERLLAELNLELWIGDAAEIRAKQVRKQKRDRQDAQHILRLLLEDRFPQIWVPSWENRDLRQLL
jgi:transposase